MRGQRRVVPQDARQPKVGRRPAGGGNHLVPLQGRDLGRPAGPRQILKTVQTMLCESPDPLPDSGATGSQSPCHGRDRLPLRRQQDRSCSPVHPGFPSLLPHHRAKLVPFHGREVQFHSNSIGQRR